MSHPAISLSSNLLADITQQREKPKQHRLPTAEHYMFSRRQDSRQLGICSIGPDLLPKQGSGRLDSVTARSIDQI